jgi:hypothetical protein
VDIPGLSVTVYPACVKAKEGQVRAAFSAFAATQPQSLASDESDVPPQFVVPFVEIDVNGLLITCKPLYYDFDQPSIELMVLAPSCQASAECLLSAIKDSPPAWDGSQLYILAGLEKSSQPILYKNALQFVVIINKDSTTDKGERNRLTEVADLLGGYTFMGLLLRQITQPKEQPAESLDKEEATTTART